MNIIESVSFTLHKEVGSINKHNVKPYHIELLNGINKNLYHDFLIYNMKKFDSSYVLGLLLTFPWLWINNSKNDWIYICVNLFPRKIIDREDMRLMNDDNDFGDIIFLHKILKINPFFFFINNKSISQKQINNILSFSITFNYKFFIEKESLIEDCDDLYNINILGLTNYSGRLISESSKIGFNSSENMVKYLERIMDSLSL